MAVAPTTSLVGTVLDQRYRIDQQLGIGGMGVVYRAQHLLLNTPVALKVLTENRKNDLDSIERFSREAQHAFRLEHAGSVRVYDFGATPDGMLYLAMEYLEGLTCGELLRADGRVPYQRATRLCAEVARALGHAHALGVLHRDIKPENIMVLEPSTSRERVKLFDFGLAKVFDAKLARESVANVVSLTQGGIVFGTPDYMSPEQALDQELSPASDIYALGAVLYHLVTGSPPFSGATFMEVLSARLHGDPQPPSARLRGEYIPPELDRIIMRCLSRDVKGRFQSAETLADALSVFAAHPTDRVPKAIANAATLQPGEVPELDVSWNTGSRKEPTLTLHPDKPPLPWGQIGAWTGVLAFLAFAGFAVFYLATRDTPAPPTRVAMTPELRAQTIGQRPPPLPPKGTAHPAPPPDLYRAPTDQPAGPQTPQLPARDNSQFKEYLAEAEAARDSGDALRQLAFADKALLIAPKNARAHFLVGDALIKSGDKQRGCLYVKRFPKQAKTLGCTN